MVGVRVRDLARQRVELLMESALKWARKDLNLAKKQAALARKMAMKYRIRLPFKYRMLFCKGCKTFIVPGINARVRISGSSYRALTITCLECGHIYRKLIKPRAGEGTSPSSRPKR